MVWFCLAFSAFYELIEWWTAGCRRRGHGLPGTQGDVWDTQWDMFMALIGAITSLVLLSRVHTRQLEWISVVNRVDSGVARSVRTSGLEQPLGVT